MKKITVAQILDNEKEYDLQLKLLNPREAKLGRQISHYRVQKHGLAFTGFTKYLDHERIQIIGRTETAYWETLTTRKRVEIARKLCQHDASCFILTSGLDPPPAMIEECAAHQIPFMLTQHKTSKFIIRINRFLEDNLTPTTDIHGVLLDLYGIGTMIIGESGIGKSECALSLIYRGHRLIADDVINVRHIPPTTLIGSAYPLLKYHMEIRGLGLINIEDIFGVTAIRKQKKIDLVIRLASWDKYDDHDRLNLEQKTYTIMGVYLPLVILPVSPGRNLSTIIEIAARNYMLTKMGKIPGRDLLEHAAAKKKISKDGR